MNNLIIFAEGTTTSGKGLIPFKIGAFVAGCPIKLSFLKYEGEFDYQYLGLSNFEMTVALLTNNIGKCTIFRSKFPIDKREGVSS